MVRRTGLALVLMVVFFVPKAQTRQEDSAFIVNNYTKIERMITMRDGVKLFTSIYIPTKTGEKYPILMERTPYSCAPYGEKNFSYWSLGPNRNLARDRYIFVTQDVRGRYRSEGRFEEMTPDRRLMKTSQPTDESSDTYDTIEWLLKNIGNNNGRVGLYGISYPGFYASASLPDAHPAIRAVSPQAPVTDEFIGDDAYHNGAFFLLDNFSFTNYFEGSRIDSGRDYKTIFNNQHADDYDFFLKIGPLKNANAPGLFNHQTRIWDEYHQHNTYDAYWQARNIRPRLKNIHAAVLVVGGWFDAEDMFGALRTYEAISKQNPLAKSWLVMGPWTHGAWSSRQWDHFGPYDFRQNINLRFREIETQFFNHFLKDQGTFDEATATVFETGSNQWKGYAQWPPKASQETSFYLGSSGLLSQSVPASAPGFDEYTSDPANPVPYTATKSQGRNNEYLVEDQRFAAGRNDVLVYQTETLREDLEVTGRLRADLFVSTTGTDLDLVVKLIDVMPGGESDSSFRAKGSSQTEGFQRLVRAEVFRGKFRKSFEHPEPFKPGEITSVAFDLNEMAHLFKKGHRLMIQIQSTWFPLVDRNPQQFLDIPNCEPADFRKAQVRIYHQAPNASRIVLPVLR